LSRRRRVETQKKDGSERWLVTYADMITLLLIFFIVMYTMSQVDAAKFESLASSLSQAMGAGGMIMESPGPSFVSGASQSAAEELEERQEFKDIQNQLEVLIQERGLAAEIVVTSEQRGIVISFQENVLFPSGSAQLTEQAQRLIDEVAPVLQETDNNLRIEGHTDNLPIHTEKFPSNWELSASRATSVLQELLRTADMRAARLSAVAYGEYRPRVVNNTSDKRQLNRRVDIVILRSKFEGSEPKAIKIISPSRH